MGRALAPALGVVVYFLLFFLLRVNTCVIASHRPMAAITLSVSLRSSRMMHEGAAAASSSSRVKMPVVTPIGSAHAIRCIELHATHGQLESGQAAGGSETTCKRHVGCLDIIWSVANVQAGCVYAHPCVRARGSASACGFVLVHAWVCFGLLCLSEKHACC